MKRCKGCMKAGVAEYCPECRKKLFGGAKVRSQLSFELPERDALAILASYNKERSLRDTRIEYAVQQEGTELVPAEERGSHILKPAPTGAYLRPEQVPANEHLTMQIAAQVYNIYTAPNGMTELSGGQPAYLTRRIDKGEDGVVDKYTLADLLRLEGMEGAHSVVGIGQLLKKYLAAWMPQAEQFFALSVFNQLIGCKGMNLQQFSILQTEHDEYRLSPFYNILCTELHESGPDDALWLTPDGEPLLREGGYSYDDLYLAGVEMGLLGKRVHRILDRFRGRELQVEYLVRQSWLSEEAKGVYLELFLNRPA